MRWDNVPSTTTDDNPTPITYTLKDNVDGATAIAKYFLQYHDEWENPTVNTGVSWPDGSNPGQTYRPESVDLAVPRIDGPQKDKTWTFAGYTVNLTATLTTEFGANFKLKDWFTAGGKFESKASLEVKAEYQANAPLLQLKEGESAVPCVNYIVKTDHKLLDHFNLSGWDRNTGWLQTTEDVELICEWTPEVFHDFQDGQEIITYSPLPPSLTLLIKSSVSGSAKYDTYSTVATATAEFENGLGSPTEAMLDEKLNPGTINEAIVKRWKSAGKILLTFSTAGAIEDAGSGKWRLQVPIKDIKLKLSTIYKPLGADRSLVTLTMRGDEFSVKTDTRRVQITSGIEASYKKVTDAAELPMKDGAVDTTKILTSKTPYPGAGPWAVLCEREDDGSMTVDSVSQWLPVEDMNMTTPYYSWFGGGTFEAEADGLTNPTTTWKFDPDSFINNSPGNKYPAYSNDNKTVDFGPEVIQMPQLAKTFGHSLGGTFLEGPSTKSTTLTAIMQDSAADKAVATNTYTVRWHKPIEGKRALPIPPGSPVYLHSFTSVGPLAKPVAGIGAFPDVELWDEPYYIQFAYDYSRIMPSFGDLTRNWLGDNKRNTGALLVLFEIFGANIDNIPLFNPTKDVINQNSQGLFDWSQTADAATDAMGPTVPAAWAPLVPPGGAFNTCRLTEPIRWRTYTEDYYQHDAYGVHGFDGVQITKLDRLTAQIWVGKYENIDNTR